MYIKEVIIDGFKSYAQRTTVKSFDPLFNAITGLNGSGKSNILDSICFVLGISNLSQVRATNLQELVYKNGQAGITKASVTIVFDNSNKKQTPVGYENFDELTVTRQVVVGGRNRYLINGSNANNNRVSDMFRSVQLNINNPHFLIMQGRITKVLNMKPPEILSMIEEAAGTSLYESKKQSALKTIEKKDVKLSEIHKILREEINPTLEKLKTERASYLEYQKVQRQIETLTRLVVAYKYTRAKNVDLTAEGEVETVRQELAKLQSDLDKSEEEKNRLRKAVEVLEDKKRNEVGSKLAAVEAKVAEASKLEVKAKSEVDNVKDGVKQEEKQKAATLKSIASTEKLITTRNSELASLQAEVAKLKEAEAQDKEQVDKAENNYTAVQAGQLEGEAGGEQMTYTERLIALKDQLSTAQTENQQAQMKLKHSKSTIKRMEASCKQAEKEIEKEKREYDTACMTVNKVEGQLKGLNFSEEKFIGLQQRKKELEHSIAQLSKQVEGLQAKFPQLSFDYTDPERNFDRRRVHGLVADLFTVPQTENCLALEVAAGGRLYNVVTDTEHTSTLLINKGQLKRRYTMIPLNKIQSGVVKPEVVQAAKRLVGADNCNLALDLVQYEKALEPAMRYCFGGVLICRTKEQAKKVAFDPSVRRTCITLDGDVYDPAGTLTGGSRNKSRVVLLELSQCKEVRTQMKGAMAEFKNVDNDINQMRRSGGQFEELSASLRLHQHERDLLKERLEQTSHFKDIESLRKTKEDLEQQESIVATFSSRESELVEKCAGVERKMKDFKSEQEKEIKKAEKTIGEAKARYCKSSKAAKTKDNALKEIELEVNSELAKELTTLRDQLPHCEAAIAAAKELVRGVEERLEECIAEHVRIKEELAGQKELIRQCNSDIEGVLHERKALDKLISTSGLKSKELNHKMNKLNKDATEAKQQVEHYLTNYEWISSEEKYFGQKDTAYDFESHNIKESDKKLDKLQQAKEKLSKNVNMRAMHLLGEAEKRYLDLMKKKGIVEGDKDTINTVIKDLDLKKNRAVKKAWEQVNKDFGSIFSTLLPGARVKLQTLEGQSVQAGLEVKVGFGDVWKETLTELSGGQRSLVALSLILSLLLFKPAPLYILDEVDAALDLSHTQNIGQMLRTHFKHSQFIVVSLKDGMFQNANVLFRTKFIDGISTVTRHTQLGGVALVPDVGDKENTLPAAKRNKKQRV